MKTTTPTKLTLRLDSALIDRAKHYAHGQDRSLSQLVADYFARLTIDARAAAKPLVKDACAPITAGLRGALRPAVKSAPASRAAYRSHLEEKYL